MPAVLSILIDDKTQKFKNLSTQSTSKIHTVLGIAENCIVKIDPELVQKLGIQDGDIVSQIEDGIGTIKLIFKDTKIRLSASTTKPMTETDDLDKTYIY
jgi:hypothetical protein